MSFHLTGDGTPEYTLDYDGRQVILSSGMGFELRGVLKAQKIDYNADGTVTKSDWKPCESLHDGFVVESVERSSHDETWAPV